MHAAASDTGDIRLYESLGFRLRRTATFLAVQVPEPPKGVVDDFFQDKSNFR